MATFAASRRSKSAEVGRFLDGGWETEDDDVRPVTASGTASTKPKSRSVRKATPQPPGDVALDGWGDFDSDRLFNGESPPPVAIESARSKEAVPVFQEEPSPPPRREPDPQRIEALVQPATKPPTSQRGSSRQVLRQRTLAVIELSAPDYAMADAPATEAPQRVMSLVAHRRDKKSDASGNDTEQTRLPTIKKGAHHSPRVRGLFGLEIADSLDARAVVYERLLPAAGVKAECKSPFKCSMVLTKICKTIGIALTASPAPDVWTSSRRRGSASDVDFELFCDFVVRNALQPAMHHFRLDRDLAEYLHTLDTIVHSLVVRVDPQEQTPVETPPSLQWRLRELSELQPVLPHWKKGILAVQKQHPHVKMAPSAATISADTEYPAAPYSDDPEGGVAVVAANEEVTYPPATVSVVLPAASTGKSTSQARKLPLYEARALQDANIRRKIQLRKSWQPRVILYDPQAQQQEKQRASTLDGAADGSAGRALGSCILVEAVHRDATADPTTQTKKDNQADDDEIAVDQLEVSPPILLLCSSCPGEQEATLWCSACFAVYCSSCWTSTHHSTVDMSLVSNQRELPAPSARPMRTQRDSLAPPVHMVYLPTKPLATGRLVRGFTSSKRLQTQGNQDEVDDEIPESSEDDEAETRLATSLSSHAILPSIRPAVQKPTMTKGRQMHRSTPTLGASAEPPPSSMDSTANLLKALMLGTASSASVLGSTDSPSSWTASSGSSESLSKRVYKDPQRRKKIYPAAITLDAKTLLPHE